MKRKLFFLLEKLEIKRSERIAMSTLLILLVILSTVLMFTEPDANFSKEHYAELEKVFNQKSEQIEQEEDVIMARYDPTREVPPAMSVREKVNSNLASIDTTVNDEGMEGATEIININTASNKLLQDLPGVGPTYAARIVEWRDENGAFKSKDQLMEIKGIGEKRLADIKPLITLQ